MADSSPRAMDAPPDARRLRMCVQYDGTDFAGWQVQPNAHTVQAAVEAALSTIAQRPIRVHAAGRTDAGVHALGQVAHLDWPAGLPHARLETALCRMLGSAVAVRGLTPVAPGFHARYDATGKVYAYTLNLSGRPHPLTARYAWTVRSALDPAQLEAVLPAFKGTHNFAGFQCAGTSVADTVRTITEVTLRPGALIGPPEPADHCVLTVAGSGFLYKMVRNIVGTVVDVARGALPPGAIDERLASAGPYPGYTAPAQGLALVSVQYPDGFDSGLSY